MNIRKAFLKKKIHYDTLSALTPYGSLWSFIVKFLFHGLILKTLLMWFLMIPRLSYLSVLCPKQWPCRSWSIHGESWELSFMLQENQTPQVSPLTCSWWPLSLHHWNHPSHQQIITIYLLFVFILGSSVQVELFLEGPHPLILYQVPLTSQKSLIVMS